MKAAWARDNRVLIGIGLLLGAALAGIYALVLRSRDRRSCAGRRHS